MLYRHTIIQNHTRQNILLPVKSEVVQMSSKYSKDLATQTKLLKSLWRLTQHYVAAVASSTTARTQVAAQVLTMRPVWKTVLQFLVVSSF